MQGSTQTDGGDVEDHYCGYYMESTEDGDGYKCGKCGYVWGNETIPQNPEHDPRN